MSPTGNSAAGAAGGLGLLAGLSTLSFPLDVSRPARVLLISDSAVAGALCEQCRFVLRVCINLLSGLRVVICPRAVVESGPLLLGVQADEDEPAVVIGDLAVGDDTGAAAAEDDDVLPFSPILREGTRPVLCRHELLVVPPPGGEGCLSSGVDGASADGADSITRRVHSLASR